MLGKIYSRRRGWHIMRWFDDITNSMNEFEQTPRDIKDMEAWLAAVPGATNSWHDWATEENQIYNKRDKNIQQGESSLFTNDVRKIESYMCKIHAGLLFHTAYINNSKCFRGLYTIPEITKLSEESCMVCFWTLVLVISLAMSLQTRETKAKVNDGTTTKISHYKWNEQTTYWMEEDIYRYVW